MLKLKLSGGNWNFGKLSPATGSLTASQDIMALVMTSLVILTNVILGYYIMKFVKTWKICITMHYFPVDPMHDAFKRQD